MPTIVLIEKNGDVKSQTFSKLPIEELYKKCSYRKPDNFELLQTWKVRIEKEKMVIRLYGKLGGKANMVNKYEMPPPIDEKLLYGCLALVNYTNDTFGDLDETMWEKIYEKLFGGFEDLNDTEKDDENEEDELKDVPEEYKTKSGYLKDGFVVDDNKESSSNGTSEIEDINVICSSNSGKDTSEESCDDCSEESSDIENEEIDEEKYIMSDDENN